MSLQAWYPLNGNTNNYGVGNLTPSGSGTIAYSAGKIGAKSLSSGGLTWTADQTASVLNNKEFSIAFWIKPVGTASGPIFGNTSMGASNNRKFCIYSYPTVNDLHWSWMNDAADVVYAGGTIEGSLPSNKWTHVCITYKNPQGYVYINGVQKTPFSGESKSSSFKYATTILHNNTSRYINDLRIYNHSLSVREVQQVSQGLILHLPLKDQNLESTTNLAPYPTPGAAYAPGWVTNLHPDAISVSDWTSGYNGGVGNPQAGYHAYWKIMDGIPTMVFQHLNSQLGLGNRWLGISCGNFQGKIGPSKTYTISFNAKSSVDGVVVSTGYYYRTTGSTSNNFHDGCPSTALTTSWKRYSFTFTTLNTLDTSVGASMYIYGHNGSVNGIAYVRNVQVELKDHATAYTPTTRTANSIMDCSGYQHHGTIVGTVVSKNDSARYDTCIYQGDGVNNYLKSGTITMPTDSVTMSCWFKSSTTGYSGYHIPMAVNSSSYELSIDSSGHFRNGFVIGGTRQVLTTSHTSILDGKWHMITATYDGATIRRYLDGKELTSYATAATGTLSGVTSELLVGSYGSGGYGNKNAYMSDVRIYATALSAAAIKTLYESRVSLNSTGAVMSYEFIEDGSTNIKMTSEGLIHAGAVSETQTAFGMPIKVLSDGSAWARIHWIDVTGVNSWFASAAEVDECIDKSNRFSRMGSVEKFIGSDGYYEFMLTYPRLSKTSFNRWKQTSSPKASTVTGFTSITTAWSAHNGGIRKHGSSCLYNCDTGSTWFAPIGQYGKWTETQYIPAADGSSQTETELWVRIDTLPSLNKISMFDNKFIQAFDIHEI